MIIAMRREGDAAQTQRALQDLCELLADVPMNHYTRYLVDCNLRDLQKDAEAGVLSEKRAQELEDLESEIQDIAWRIRRY